MSVYFKATRPDGTDFFSGTIDYAAAIGGWVKAPGKANPGGYECCAPGVLHASDVPTEVLVGGSWPCRLFEVSGRPVAQEGHKFGFRSLAVVREVDAHAALGPQGREVAALIEQARVLTWDEIDRLYAARYDAWSAAWNYARNTAWNTAWNAAWSAARNAARNTAGDTAGDTAWSTAWSTAGDTAWSAARYAAWSAARYAAGALVVRDLIGVEFTQAHYDLLTRPWREVIGPVHPDDAPLFEEAAS